MYQGRTGIGNVTKGLGCVLKMESMPRVIVLGMPTRKEMVTWKEE